MIRSFLKQYPDESLERQICYQADERLVPVAIDGFDDKQLDALLNLAKSFPSYVSAVSKKINTLRAISKDPAGRECRRLEDLALALKEHLKDVPNHWLFEELNDGLLLVPLYVSRIQYHPAEHRGGDNGYIPAYVTMDVKWMRRGHKRVHTYRWDREDLIGGRTIGELFQELDLHLATEEMIKDYHTQMERYKQFQPRTGAQFIGKGEGTEIGADAYSHDVTSVVQDGTPDKLVMDDIDPEAGEFRDDTSVISDTFWNKRSEEDAEEETEKHAPEQLHLPVHPYLKLFDLDRHSFIELHVEQLREYKWDTSLGDKLILPYEHKEVIQILMETANEQMDDIIKGKSGGTICICTGEPGTGKTLTAEVTSEVIQRPLYKVNCSQLGTDETSIERELQRVLARATRWMALLLIDEADVYVRARENDIQQNAIVGVFLRVLEYYRGILFLTSNRAVVIDDAIMSRATVHLKYERPMKPMLAEIWRVLSKQFDMKLSDKLIEQLVDTFPRIVGRDVKALLKLVSRYTRRDPKKINLEVFQKMAKHKIETNQ